MSLRSDRRPRRKEGLHDGSLTALCCHMQGRHAEGGRSLNSCTRREEDLKDGSLAPIGCAVQRGGAVSECCPNRGPRRKQDLHCKNITTLCRTVQRGSSSPHSARLAALYSIASASAAKPAYATSRMTSSIVRAGWGTGRPGIFVARTIESRDHLEK